MVKLLILSVPLLDCGSICSISKRGVDVYPVNPTAVYDYRKSRFPSGSKSDAADAQLLADYLAVISLP